MSHLSKLRNYWLFPGLAVGLLALGLFYGNGWCLLASAYYFLIICCKKQWLLVSAMLLCGFFVVLQLNSLDYQRTPKASYTGVLTIESDTVALDHELVRFDGTDSTGRKYRTTMILKEADQKRWRDLNTRPDRISIKGETITGESPRNLHGFHQLNYFRSEGYYARLNVKKVVDATVGKKTGMTYLRAKLIQHVSSHFPAKLRTYLNALLLGFKDPDYDDLQKDLSASGILHLFSISGMHVFLFLGLLDLGLRWLRLTVSESLPILILFAVVMAVLFGNSASVLRALLLFLLTKAGSRQLGLFSSSDRFGITLLLLHLIDPLVLTKTGGQLSLVMALFLVLLPKSTGKLSGLQLSWWLTVVSCPVTAWFFFEWPLLGGVLTVIYLPIFAWFFLPVGFLLLGFSLVGLCPGFLKDLFEGLFTLIEKPLHYLEWSALPIGRLPLIMVLIVALAGLWLLQTLKGRRRWLACLVCIGVPFTYQWLSLDLLVAFVDIGQGDAILFKAPFKQEVVLVDTGGKMQFGETQRKIRPNVDYTLLPFLRSRGITTIHRVILTHGDTDHMGDLLPLMEEVKVRELVLGIGSENHPQVRSTLKKIPRKTRVRLVRQGEVINGWFDFAVLAPKTEGAGENEDSIVLYSRIKDKGFLLTGDLDQAGELSLLKSYPQLQADVLKVGHHGSRTSSHPRFIHQLAPEDAIISAGYDNRFGHPHQEVLDTMKQENVRVLRTDQRGMIYYRWLPWQQETEPQDVKSN